MKKNHSTNKGKSTNVVAVLIVVFISVVTLLALMSFIYQNKKVTTQEKAAGNESGVCNYNGGCYSSRTNCNANCAKYNNSPCVALDENQRVQMCGAGWKNATAYRCCTQPSKSCDTLLARINTAMFSKCGETKYDKVADIDKNGEISTVDAQKVSYRYTDEAFCAGKLADNTDPCSQATPNCKILIDRMTTAWNTKCGDAKYDKVADRDKDKDVDIQDIQVVASRNRDETFCLSILNNTTDPCINP